MEPRREFKVLLVGDGGVGKSCYIKRMKERKFSKKYKVTVAVEVEEMKFETSYGEITFNFWNVAGQWKFGNPRQHFLDADAAIIMYSTDSRVTYKNVKTWYDEIVDMCGKIPMVVVGNKVDIPDREVNSDQIASYQNLDLKCQEMSVKSWYNWEEPVLEIMRLLTGDTSITLIA